MRLDVNSYFECKGNVRRETGGWMREKSILLGSLGSFGYPQVVDGSWVKKSENEDFLMRRRRGDVREAEEEMGVGENGVEGEVERLD